jgi:hypothetical protein
MLESLELVRRLPGGKWHRNNHDPVSIAHQPADGVPEARANFHGSCFVFFFFHFGLYGASGLHDFHDSSRQFQN